MCVTSRHACTKVSWRNKYAISWQIHGHHHWCIQFSLLQWHIGIWISKEVHDPDLRLLLWSDWSGSAPPPVSGQDGDPCQKWLYLMLDLPLQLEGSSLRFFLLSCQDRSATLRISPDHSSPSTPPAKSLSRTTIIFSPSRWDPPTASKHTLATFRIS